MDLHSREHIYNKDMKLTQNTSEELSQTLQSKNSTTDKYI